MQIAVTNPDLHVQLVQGDGKGGRKLSTGATPVHMLSTETIPPTAQVSRPDATPSSNSRALERPEEKKQNLLGGASPGENKQNWRASYTVYSSAQLQEAKFDAGVYT